MNELRIVGQLNKVEMQMMYENTFNKRQLNKWLYEIFSPLIQQDEVLNNPEHKWEQQVVIKLLSILAEKHSLYLDTAVAMLKEREEEIDVSVQKIAKIIFYCASKNYLTLVEGKSNYQLLTKFKFNKETQAKVDKFKYLNPMLVQPLKVNQKNNNRGSGQLTIASDSLILGGVYHNNCICTDTLDYLNNVCLELNEEVIRTYRNEWKDLESPKDNETQSDYEKRVASFEHYEKGCYQTFAEMISNDNTFWLTHKYDKRGRVYCQGYYISYQGNSYAKAILQFKNKERISDNIQFYED